MKINHIYLEVDQSKRPIKGHLQVHLHKSIKYVMRIILNNNDILDSESRELHHRH